MVGDESRSDEVLMALGWKDVNGKELLANEDRQRVV